MKQPTKDENFIVAFPNFGRGLLDHFGGSVEDAEAAATHNYQGFCISFERYILSRLSDIAELPSITINYINIESLKREQLDKFNVFAVDDHNYGIHIFNRKGTNSNIRYRSLAEQESKAKIKQEFIDGFPSYGEALLAHFHGNLAEARDAATYNYLRYSSSIEEYLRYTLTCIPDLPDFVTNSYVDFESMATKSLDEFKVFAVDDKESGVHIFSK